MKLLCILMVVIVWQDFRVESKTSAIDIPVQRTKCKQDLDCPNNLQCCIFNGDFYGQCKKECPCKCREDSDCQQGTKCCEGQCLPPSECCVQVKCSFTVDNVIEEVKYNGVTLEVDGQLNDWRKENTISFESCDAKDPGKLSIKGRDYNSNNNCYWGGLLLHCKASDTTSPWHNFKSGVDHWLDENGDVPCQNDLLFPSSSYGFIVALNSLGAKKIWAPRQNVVLTGSPPP